MGVWWSGGSVSGSVGSVLGVWWSGGSVWGSGGLVVVYGCLVVWW